ncbi:MAG: O-antigen ligase family protein, partial [Anaerolineales bacterium]
WPYVQTLESFQRLGTTGTELTEGDLNNRTNNWSEGLNSFVEHPLLGVGSNMYRSVNSLGKVGHNSFISVLVELGLVGFLLFGIILAIVVTQAWSHPLRWDKSFWLTVFAVWTIGSSTLTWEHRKTTWLFLSFIVASAILARRREKKVYKARRLPGPIKQTTVTQKEVLSH